MKAIDRRGQGVRDREAVTPYGTTALHADAFIAAALERARRSGNVIRWEAAPEWMQRKWGADCWHAIWHELAAAYGEQQRGEINYRLTADDVGFAERMALWGLFEVAVSEWKRVPENRAALATWQREIEVAAAQGREPKKINLDDVARKRIESYPKRPDTFEVAIAFPHPSEAPRDWPAFGFIWSEWVARLIASRRPTEQPALFEREAGDDSEDAGSGGAEVEHVFDSPTIEGATPSAAAPVPEDQELPF